MPLHEPDGGARPPRTPFLAPPATPTTKEELLAASGLLAPDSAGLDALITGSYVKLMLTARDESIRLEATRDLTRARGFFARAKAKAAVGAGAALGAIAQKPDVFARLLQGLSELGVARPEHVAAVRLAAAEPLPVASEDPEGPPTS